MRKHSFLSIAATVGLVIGLFAAAIGTAGAVAPGGTVGSTSALYFPWVHNGDTVDGMGPFSGTVTIQNLENAGIDITLKTASGHATSSYLNPHASKTFDASLLQVADGGEGVKVDAFWHNPSTAGVCSPYTLTVPHAATNGTDVVSLGGLLGKVLDVYTVATHFSSGSDYVASGIGTYTLSLDWSPSGAEPAAFTAYQVDVLLCQRSPWIAGVEKHMTPEGTNSAMTTSNQTTVDGYSALSNLDLPWTDSSTGGAIYQSFLPIVQTNTGWDSVIHVTNFGSNNAGVTLTFYAAAGQGAAGPSQGAFTKTMASGSTWTFDLSAEGFPDGYVGDVYISSDTQKVVTQVDRVKPSTDMALTNVGAPRWGGAADWFNETAPLVFRNYNGWNTGINIANLSDNDNTITVTYYNQSGNVVGVEQRTIPKRAMEYIYQPNSGDLNLDPNAITSATLKGTDWFQASVDEVKYMAAGGQSAGHAMSYIATAQGAPAGAMLSMPLYQKGSMTTGMGDTSGLNIFNPDSSNSVQGELTFYDSSGSPVAPTIGTPIPIDLSAHEAVTIYSMSYDEMPNGFQGSAAINVTGGGGEMDGVSNNVNYAVNGDGSAVFTMLSTCGNFTGFCPQVFTPADHMTLTPATQTHTVGQNAQVVATVYAANNDVLTDYPVYFEVRDPGNNLVTGGYVSTNNVGQAFFTFTDTTAETDTVTVYDFYGNAAPQSVQATFTAGAAAKIALLPATQNQTAGGTATLTATVTDQYSNPVAGATVNFAVNSLSANPASGSGTTDATGNVQFSYSNTAAGTDTVTASSGALTPATAQVVWGAGAIGGNTSVTCTAGAAGSGQAGCSATLMDQYGNPIAGQVVNFQVTSGSGTLTSNSATTDSTGTTSPVVTVNGTSGTSVTVTAFVDTNNNGTYESGTDTLVGTSTVTLGVPAGSTLTVTCTPSGTTAGQADCTAVMQDSSSNPIAGQVVTFSTDIDSVSPTTATTDASGSAGPVTVTGTHGDVVTVTATGGGLTGSTTVTLPSNTLTLTCKQGAIGSGQLGCTTQLRDPSGNPISGQTVIFSASGFTSAVTLTPTSTPTTGSPNGYASVTVTGTPGDSGTITVSSGGAADASLSVILP